MLHVQQPMPQDAASLEVTSTDISEGDWADDWSDEFSWFYDGNEYENTVDLDDIIDTNLSENENLDNSAVESQGEESESSEDRENDVEASMSDLPLIAEAPHVLEPCFPIEKLPGVCQMYGFRVCGDNIDKTIHRRFLRSDRENISIHYFHSYAVLNRVDFSHLSDDIPDNSTTHDLNRVALSLQPTALDDEILHDNISTLISRILCTRMEFFKVCFQDLIQWHIKHKYTIEMSQKSVVVSFPIHISDPF